MASQKISQLAPLVSAGTEDLLIVLDSSVPETKKITVSNLVGSITLAGDVEGTPYSNYYRSASIKDVHISQSANINWTKLNYSGSSIPTGSYYTGTSSYSITSSNSIYASTYDLNYLGNTLGQLTYRNKLINGNFNIWQRGNSFENVYSSSVLFGDYSFDFPYTYSALAVCTADRWIWLQRATASSTLNITIEKDSTDKPTSTGGETPIKSINVLKLTVNTAEEQFLYDGKSQLCEDSYYILKQSVEGYLCNSFAYSPMVLSFWAKTDFPFSVCVSAGGTVYHPIDCPPSTSPGSWRKYELLLATIPDAVANTMFSDNRFAMTVNFVIGAGRVYGNPSSVDSYLTGSWKGSEYYVNKTDLVPINNILLSQGKTFKLSQVQLEPGIASTQFEVQPPKEELESCQRYFCSTSPIKTVAVDPTAYILGNNGLRIFSPSGSTAAPFDEYPTATWQFPVTMRTYPKLRSFNSRMNTLSSGIWLSATDIINSTSTNVSKALYCADTTPEPNGDPSSIYGSDVTLSPPRLSYNVENFTVAIEYNDGPAATYYTDLCADAEEYF